jgi:3-oxoacyl-[acyl-carrier-protein] synthase-3
VIAATGFAVKRITSKSLFDLAMPAVEAAIDGRREEISAVVAATFSNEVRFPSLAVKVAGALGLASSIPAFDLQMACSAYPYALFTAGQWASMSGGKVLVIDGDVQSRFASDASTLPVTSDACTASVVSAREGSSHFAFYSSYGEELKCAERMEMDGFGVFSFVACEVAPFLKRFIADIGDVRVDAFVPHQANMYMVRQLANTLGLADKLHTSGEKYANPGSVSIPLTIAERGVSGRALIAGFGAGLSASAAIVTVKSRD